MAGAPPLHPVALKLRLQHPCRDSVPAPCQRALPSGLPPGAEPLDPKPPPVSRAAENVIHVEKDSTLRIFPVVQDPSFRSG